VRRLGTVLIALAFLAAGCGGEGSHTIASLVAQEDALDGEHVEVTGVVQRLGEAEGSTVVHYVLQDPDANRVKLLPDEAVAGYVSRVVRVEGRFSFSETTGRVLHVEEIAPLASDGG
jgi:hypothetical protein